MTNKEAREARFWLKVLMASGLVDNDEVQVLYDESDQLIRYCSRLIYQASFLPFHKWGYYLQGVKRREISHLKGAMKISFGNYQICGHLCSSVVNGVFGMIFGLTPGPLGFGIWRLGFIS